MTPEALAAVELYLCFHIARAVLELARCVPAVDWRWWAADLLAGRPFEPSPNYLLAKG